jgi:hypothetical protein
VKQYHRRPFGSKGVNRIGATRTHRSTQPFASSLFLSSSPHAIVLSPPLLLPRHPRLLGTPPTPTRRAEEDQNRRQAVLNDRHRLAAGGTDEAGGAVGSPCLGSSRASPPAHSIASSQTGRCGRFVGEWFERSSPHSFRHEPHVRRTDHPPCGEPTAGSMKRLLVTPRYTVAGSGGEGTAANLRTA